MTNVDQINSEFNKYVVEFVNEKLSKNFSCWSVI